MNGGLMWIDRQMTKIKHDWIRSQIRNFELHYKYLQ